MSDASPRPSAGPSNEHPVKPHEIPASAGMTIDAVAPNPSAPTHSAAGAIFPSQADGEDTPSTRTPTPSQPPSPEAEWLELASRARPPRHNEWTRAKMVAFLRELAASQSVAQAARAVGMSRQSAYRLRNRLVGTPFALGWEVALEAGFVQLAHAMMDRAVNGVEVPHYYHGELVGTSRQFDERLAIWVLENPWKMGRQQMAREYVAEGFDALLERIELAPLDWQPGESLPGAVWPENRRKRGVERENGFFNRSWYAAEAEGIEKRGKRGVGR